MMNLMMMIDDNGGGGGDDNGGDDDDGLVTMAMTHRHTADIGQGAHTNGTVANGTSANGSIKNERLKNDNVNISGIPGLSINILGTFMLLWPPLFVWYFWLACNSYQCSLGSVGNEFLSHFHDRTVLAFVWQNVPEVSLKSVVVFFTWMLVQLVLYLVLPGRKATGNPTPAGNALPYNCNGFNAWMVTHALFLAAVKLDWIKMTIIHDHWGALLILANIFGFVLTGFCYFKALYFPSHKEDRCFSGSFFYDMFMGVELNPRIGDFDFKLFFNGRPGIVAWTLINLSFAAKQYENLGYVTNSMVIVNVLQAFYVIDYFINEVWYLRTIDIAHDHFGFYLAWGDMVWLPFMYTLQAVYLVYNPVNLPLWAAAGVLGLGLAGYFIFRSANSQKDYFRSQIKKTGECTIWGKPAVYISAEYQTSDGIVKQSCLLASGWWGISRHFNYVGDLMNSLSYCLACGVGHVLPQFYVVYMTILLVHR
ncbi:hypothetical protein QZH41_008890, partial [Actinostola sp. cb2023]